MKATDKNTEAILNGVGVRPTAVRMLVYDALRGFGGAFCLADIESALPHMDKSSVFRALTAFHAAHLIHTVPGDGQNTLYCLCHNEGHCQNDEAHCHFFCEKCGHTFCLDKCPVPAAALPGGYQIRAVTYLAKGLCPECAQKL